MKKALSIVLSVAMVLTLAASAFVMSATAAPLTDSIIELMNPDYIVEGTENVTVNADGTWTITNNFAMRCEINYDLSVVQNICQDLETNTPVKITIYDEPNGQRWIGLYDNWVGPSHFPVGTYNGNNGILGIYNWNKWDYTNGANITAIYFEFDGATADTVMTLNNLYLNDGTLKPTEVNFGDAAFEYNTTTAICPKDADIWEQLPTSGSMVNITFDAEKLVLGNTAAAWPAVCLDYATPYVIDEQSMLYVDFSVANKAKTTIYLFFGQATCTEFDNGAYGVVHNAYGAEVGYGNYKGYISIADILPTDETARAACYNDNGELVITGIKLFATSTTEEAVDPAVTIRSFDLLTYVEEEEVLAGDITGDGKLNIGDAMKLFAGVSGKVTLTEEQSKAADFDGNGKINIADAMKLFAKVSGK